ncbi:hypothetical protein ROSEINA2194_01966 [Roseburia inulinivorans DSM 16841]|uniref:Uncharacterized protein n=1 Tax=Roseburia inulinivorans DSM 16841 TaxID=622312 RepID=C0FT96_9FIRM|nr:hypothetical protein ROSEINA2194_01966 [Roseburia inulinivorans DSM 16841]
MSHYNTFEKSGHFTEKSKKEHEKPRKTGVCRESWQTPVLCKRPKEI